MDTPNIGGEQQQRPAASSGKSTNVRMFLIGLLGLIGIVVVVTALVGVYRVYAKTGTDKFTVAIAKILHLPALKVGAQTIPYSDYVDDLKAIHIMRDYDKANNGAGANLSEQDMSDQVLWRLANIQLVNEAAKTYNLAVDQKDIDDLKSQLIQQFKTTDAVNTELEKRYGWDLNTYETKVMRPFVLQNKLQDALTNDTNLKTDLQNKAQGVLDQIKNGADFAAMARQYGSDSTAAQGGDLGWFGRGEMVPQFEEAAFSLKKGELDPNLVETSYGFHIIKVTDTRTQAEKDSKTGKTTQVQQVRASHILFPFVTLSDYLNNLAKTTDMHLYLHVHNPFTAVLNATSTAATGDTSGQ